jgi:hypothetical protein
MNPAAHVAEAAALVVQAATEPSGIAAAVTLAGAAGVGYWISLKRHPWTACARCKGRSINRDPVFGRTFGDCRACGGTGRKLRLGVRLFQPNRKP